MFGKSSHHVAAQDQALDEGQGVRGARAVLSEQTGSAMPSVRCSPRRDGPVQPQGF